ncbi:hypothetical protein V8G54_006933 [Vigna mungo]|uniref:Uncharacterized protein n=1 Tax=Vigna mungo TaxID=3915 RepID=A0AAQ3P2I1_VIGMU
MVDGYSSMISCCIDYEKSKIIGFCDYCHILMQHLLSMVIHNVLLDHVISLSVEFYSFLKYLCYKRLNVLDLDNQQHCIVVALFHLESFFAFIILHCDDPFNSSYCRRRETWKISLLLLDVFN